MLVWQLIPPRRPRMDFLFILLRQGYGGQAGSSFHRKQTLGPTALLFVACFFDVHFINRGLEPLLDWAHPGHTQVGDGDAEEAV